MGIRVIGQKKFEVTETELLQQDLLFYLDNPRVYSVLHENGHDNPTQTEIEEIMCSLDHVKSLKSQIMQNGGLIEPLIVVKRKDRYVVLEGNSRLAAYRILAKNDPLKWSRVLVQILPEDISDSDIFTLLGTFHLNPKKDWSKFEQAAYIYRQKKELGCSDSAWGKQVGISAITVKKYCEIYGLMVEHTFEWENTKKALQYALSVVKPGGKVFTGGILATLRPEWIAKEFPTVINNTGLLNHEGTLGLKGEECIDTLPLDYGILDDIKDEYKYPAEDAYFTYMTRGCGMNCTFCAVKTLEPTYEPYEMKSIWCRNDIRDTSMMKLSTATGYIYGYVQDLESGMWQFIMLDFETGETAFTMDVSDKPGYNNMAIGMYAGNSGNTLYCPTGYLELLRLQDRFVYLPEMPYRKVDLDKAKRNVLTQEEFTEAGGKGNVAGWLNTITVENVHPNTTVAIRMKGIAGKADTFTLYAYDKENKLKEVPAELWHIQEEDGTLPDKLTEDTLYEVHVMVEDGGEFDLSDTEKEIKIAVILGNK